MGNRLIRERLLRKSLAVLCAASIILTGAGFGAGISAYAEVEPAVEEEEHEEKEGLEPSDETDEIKSLTNENENSSQNNTKNNSGNQNQDGNDDSDSDDGLNKEDETPGANSNEKKQETQEIKKDEKPSDNNDSNGSSANADQTNQKGNLPTPTENDIPSDSQKKDGTSNPVEQVPTIKRINTNGVNQKKVELDEEPEIMKKAAADDAGTKAEGDGIDTYEPVEVIIPFTKEWDDEQDAFGIRPTEITVKLYRFKGEAYDPETDLFESATVKADNDWYYEFKLTDKDGNEDAFYYDSDNKEWIPYNFAIEEEPIKYYVESEHVDPSVKMTTLDGEGNWTIINPNSVTEFPINTEAKDKNYIAAKKGNQLYIWTPEKLSPIEQKIILEQVQSHPQFPDEDWEHTDFFSGIGYYSAGGFTIEAGDPGKIKFDFHSSWSFWARGTYSRSTPEENAGSIKNKADITTVTVSKVWENADGSDTAPENASVEFTLSQDGEEIKTIALDGTPDTDGEPEAWLAAFTTLPIHAEDGSEIEYTVAESKQWDGYTLVSENPVSDGGTITNKQDVGSLKITKEWEGTPEDEDLLNGLEITINDGTEDKIITYKDFSDGVYWIENIPVGTEYSVSEKNAEDLIEGYTLDKDGSQTKGDGTIAKDKETVIALKNVYTQDTGTLKIIKTFEGVADDADVSGLKFEITDADGKTIEEVTYEEFKADAYLIEDLPAGQTYSVRETNADSLLDGYTFEANKSTTSGRKTIVKGEDAVIELKNVYTQDTGSLKITKKVTVDGKATTTTEADGTYKFDVTGPDNKLVKTVEVTIKNGKSSSTTLEELVPGDYSVAEVKPTNGTEIVGKELQKVTVKAGETAEVSFTNNKGKEPEPTPPTPPYKPSDPPTPPVVPEEKINIPVVKLWSDNNNAAGKRPASITVTLAADGVLTGDKLVLSDANEWKGVFADLPKWKAGNRIQYTVLEDLVPGYVPAVLGDKDTGFTLVNRLATVPSAINATGDDSHMRVYGMISAVSLIAIIGCLFFWRRKKKG